MFICVCIASMAGSKALAQESGNAYLQAWKDADRQVYENILVEGQLMEKFSVNQIYESTLVYSFSSSFQDSPYNSLITASLEDIILQETEDSSNAFFTNLNNPDDNSEIAVHTQYDMVCIDDLKYIRQHGLRYSEHLKGTSFDEPELLTLTYWPPEDRSSCGLTIAPLLSTGWGLSVYIDDIQTFNTSDGVTTIEAIGKLDGDTPGSWTIQLNSDYRVISASFTGNGREDSFFSFENLGEESFGSQFSMPAQSTVSYGLTSWEVYFSNATAQSSDHLSNVLARESQGAEIDMPITKMYDFRGEETVVTYYKNGNRIRQDNVIQADVSEQ